MPAQDSLGKIAERAVDALDCNISQERRLGFLETSAKTGTNLVEGELSLSLCLASLAAIQLKAQQGLLQRQTLLLQQQQQVLKRYRDSRHSDKHEYRWYSCLLGPLALFGRFGRFSREEKLSAVNKLSQRLACKSVVFTETDKAALQQGRLGTAVRNANIDIHKPTTMSRG